MTDKFEIKKSQKLANVFYDIRGPVLDAATKMEEEGHRILKLNVGNPAPFGLNAPDEIITDVIRNLHEAEGYSASKGIYSARKAVMQYCQQKTIPHLDIDHIYLGNGVSELISVATQALINPGDEVLIPAPDYPLWTGSVTLAGGKAVHYMCDESQNWYPDIEDMRAKINSRTKAIVIINPNNPTGAVYPKEILEQIVQLARENNLMIMSDEIYDKIIFDEAKHISTASLAPDVLCLTFNGLSKSYRLAGFRSGWMVLTGPKRHAKDFIEGLNMLSSMRLCCNVPGQIAIQTALGGYQSINDLVAPGGRIYEQRNLAWKMLNDIPGISCTKPEGALYSFAKMDTKKFNIQNDETFVLDLLKEQKILLVHGRAFNWPDVDHFRVVYLPDVETLKRAGNRMAEFFANYKQ